MTRLAAVDMGTNSTRLLVADSDGPGAGGPLSTIERHMHITRLGQGVNAARKLHPDAIERTLSVLRKYRDIMDSTGVDGVRASATSAARDAAEDVFRTLATEPAADRRHNPGLEPARVDVIVGGAAVLVAVMRHWGFEEMIVSEADILDGLIRSQL